MSPRRAPRTLAAAWTIAGNDLRRARRDRTAWLTGIIAPLGLALLIGLALGDMAFTADIAIVDEDGSALSEGIVDGLVSSMPPDSPLHLRRADSTDAGVAGLRTGTVQALIVVPDGFGDSVIGMGDPKELRVVSVPRQRFAGDLARSLADGVAGRIDLARLAVSTALATSPPDAPADIPGLVGAAIALEPGLGVKPETSGDAYRPIAYFGASMTVVFLFFTMGASARTALAEHAEGTLTRLRSSPVPARSLLIGRALSALTLGIASLVTVWLVTTVGFGARWGDPVGVLAVMVASVLAVAGIGSLVTGLARTVPQADAFTTLAAFLLALLGGSFQPAGSLPGIFQQLALFTPNGIAQRAFVLLGAGDADLAEIAPLLGALLGIAVVTLLVGVMLIRRRVTT